MKTINLEKDTVEAAMAAWNVLSDFLDVEDGKFDDFAKFSSFYTLVVTKLHEEESEDN